MNSKNLQKKIDKIINKLFLWAIPKWLKPNFFTWLRIASVPFLFWLLSARKFEAAIILFIVSASTDFIDGALARTRDQITEFGILVDPIADKLLIATILAVLGIHYLIVQIFLVFIAIEILAILLSAFLAYQIGRPPGANFFGKVKMILQCLAVFLLLSGLIFHQKSLIRLATISLFIALGFALASSYEQIRSKFDRLLAFLKIKKSFQTLKNLLRRI